MEFTKITQADLVDKGVIGLPDTPNLSTSEMQRKFDEIATDVIVPKFNSLSQELDELTLDKRVLSADVTDLKINEDNQIEVSFDWGETWQATASSGHVIENGAGTQFPPRSRLQFSNNVIVTDQEAENKTLISVKDGEKGDKGDAATITVGNVSPGETASVTNIGSDTDAIFDFVLPRGQQGLAATMQVGTVSSGTTASVSNRGTTSAAILDFILPKGEKGDPGTGLTLLGQYPSIEALRLAHPTGVRGNAYFVGDEEEGTVYLWNPDDSDWVDIGALKGAKGDTGATGTISIGTVTEVTGSPTVENVGTSTAAIFNFGLKRGEKGEKGDSGTISIGTVTEGDYPAVVNVGTPENAILNFTLQRGEQGLQGTPTVVNGKNGANINIYATDVQMSSGDSTLVSANIGTMSNLHAGDKSSLVNAMNENRKIISDEWNAETTYAVGDYCIKGNTLYRCIQQNTNVAPPNASYWVATSVSDSLKEKWDVLNSTTYTLETASVERVVTIPNLSKYSEICVLANAGDGMGRVNALIKRPPNGISYYEICNVGNDGNWRASMHIAVNFNSNTIGIVGYTANWALTTCNFSTVWGLKLA